jgi:hypothetical protein
MTLPSELRLAQVCIGVLLLVIVRSLSEVWLQCLHGEALVTGQVTPYVAGALLPCACVDGHFLFRQSLSDINGYHCHDSHSPVCSRCRGLMLGAHVRNCEGFRIPAHHNGWGRLEAGVRNPPGKEPAGDREERAASYGELSFGMGFIPTSRAKGPFRDPRRFSAQTIRMLLGVGMPSARLDQVRPLSADTWRLPFLSATATAEPRR